MSTASNLSALFVIVLLAPLSFAGDGLPDGKKSLGGSGEMIQLHMPEESSALAGIEVHGSRYGSPAPPNEKFLIYVMDEQMSKIVAAKMAPYSLFERGDEQWVVIKFDEPIQFPENGWVVLDFRAGRTKGVYVSYDSNGEGKRSKVGLPGMEPRDTDFDGSWMIRPIVAGKNVPAR